MSEKPHQVIAHLAEQCSPCTHHCLQYQSPTPPLHLSCRADSQLAEQLVQQFGVSYYKAGKGKASAAGSVLPSWFQRAGWSQRRR